MMKKKGQQDIIVTVLLVLIALAAVALVATFVVKNVKTSTAGAEQKQNCLKLEFDITRAVNAESTVTVIRQGESSIDLKNINVFVNGALKNSTVDLTGGQSMAVLVGALSTGQKVEISAVINDGSTSGYTCPVSIEESVAAA